MFDIFEWYVPTKCRNVITIIQFHNESGRKLELHRADLQRSNSCFVVHICHSMQGLVRTRRVAQGEIDIRVGNKARVSALEVGTMQLQLPSGFILELNNCYYIPALSQKEAGAASC